MSPVIPNHSEMLFVLHHVALAPSQVLSGFLGGQLPAVLLPSSHLLTCLGSSQQGPGCGLLAPSNTCRVPSVLPASRKLNSAPLRFPQAPGEHCSSCSKPRQSLLFFFFFFFNRRMIYMRLFPPSPPTPPKYFKITESKGSKKRPLYIQ